MLRNRRFVVPVRRPIAAVVTAVAVTAVALVAGATTALVAVTPALAATAASSTSGSSQLSAAASTSSTTLSDAQKLQRVVDETNEVRAKAATTPLVRNSALDKVAGDWAYQQWKNGAMSHNPNYSTQIPKGWTHAGENVAEGYTYDEVVPAWVDSPEHYRNLVGDYTDVGIGYYEGPDGTRYWSQVFAKYASTTVPPTQTPTAPSAPAEPAAPAGTAIALSSPSFEGGMTGWSGSGASVEGPVTTARGGRYDLAVTGSTTVSQSVTTTVAAGDTDTATIWVKPGGSGAVSGSLTLTATGGTAETGSVSFTTGGAGSGWMQVSVSLPITGTRHTGLTLAVKLPGSGAALRLDSVSLVRVPSTWTATPARVAVDASTPGFRGSSATTPSPTSISSASPTAPAARTSASGSSSSASPAPAATPSEPAD